MTKVLIQPSLGSAAARRHWAETMAQPVAFDALPLTEAERAELRRIHGDSPVRFWGLTAHHSTRAQGLQEGDVVLFTGKKMVQGVGEIGAVFQNQAVGDALWVPDGNRGSYVNVYSLRAFAPVQIPYEEIWELPSFNAGDNFMAARFLDDAKSKEILDGLGIQTSSQVERENANLTAGDITETPSPGYGGGQVTNWNSTAGEAMHTTSSEHLLPERVIVVNRREAALMHAYWESLSMQAFERSECAAGLTDMIVRLESGGIELVEAKAESTRSAVRTAIGQLFDYAAYMPEVEGLTILIPEAPAPDIERLVTGLGVALVYRDGDMFTRIAGSQEGAQTIFSLLKGIHAVSE